MDIWVDTVRQRRPRDIKEIVILALRSSLGGTPISLSLCCQGMVFSTVHRYRHRNLIRSGHGHQSPARSYLMGLVLNGHAAESLDSFVTLPVPFAYIGFHSLGRCNLVRRVLEPLTREHISSCSLQFRFRFCRSAE